MSPPSTASSPSNAISPEIKAKMCNPNNPSPKVVNTTEAHIINALIEKVDIADWLFNLLDAEYQLCSPVHIAAGHTATDDECPMSINVETIGEALMVQHLVGEELKPHFCRLTSISDAITTKGRTKVRIFCER